MSSHDSLFTWFKTCASQWYAGLKVVMWPSKSILSKGGKSIQSTCKYLRHAWLRCEMWNLPGIASFNNHSIIQWMMIIPNMSICSMPCSHEPTGSMKTAQLSLAHVTSFDFAYWASWDHKTLRQCYYDTGNAVCSFAEMWKAERATARIKQNLVFQKKE